MDGWTDITTECMCDDRQLQGVEDAGQSMSIVSMMMMMIVWLEAMKQRFVASCSSSICRTRHYHNVVHKELLLGHRLN